MIKQLTIAVKKIVEDKADLIVYEGMDYIPLDPGDQIPRKDKDKQDAYFNLQGKLTDSYYQALQQALLMKDELRDSRRGKEYLLSTLSKLFDPSRISVFSNLKLINEDCINVVCQSIKLYRVKQGTQLPTDYKGMFFLLSGKLQIQTKWEIDKGMTDSEKFYQDYIRSHQGYLNSDLRRPKNNSNNKVENKLKTKLFTKLFDLQLNSNPYLKELQISKFVMTQIPKFTTHTNPELQQLLTGVGLQQFTEESYLTHVTKQLIDQEFRILNQVITDKDSQGYGVGIAEPGFCFHQAVLTGSHNYLLHYNLTIVEGDAIIAHVSRNGLENNLKKVNDAKILEYCDFLTKIPTFQSFQAKTTKIKLLNNSRRVSVPKGWNFNSNKDPTKFCLILSGNFELTYGKPQDQYQEQHKFEMKSLIMNDSVSRQDRTIIAQQDKLHYKLQTQTLKEKQSELYKKSIFCKGQIFGEESILGLMNLKNNWYAKLDQSKIYDVQCTSFGAEIIIFDVWQAVLIIKGDQNAQEQLKISYTSKIPNLRTYKPNQIELYNQVLNDKQLQQSKKKEDWQNKEIVQNNQSLLPPENIRVQVFQNRPAFEKRLEYQDVVRDFPQLKTQRNIFFDTHKEFFVQTSPIKGLKDKNAYQSSKVNDIILQLHKRKQSVPVQQCIEKIEVLPTFTPKKKIEFGIYSTKNYKSPVAQTFRSSSNKTQMNFSLLLQSNDSIPNNSQFTSTIQSPRLQKTPEFSMQNSRLQTKTSFLGKTIDF